MIENATEHESGPRNGVVDVMITELSKKGNGLGRIIAQNGIEKIVEVPFSIPGDKVRVLISRKRSGVHHGRLQELLNPSADRIPARCIHFGICGGCRWQQTPYALQLRWKEAVVAKHLSPHLSPGISIRPIVPCEPPWNYRNKMEFSFSSDLAKHRFLGLIMDSSNGKVLNLTECHLVDKWFVDARQAVMGWWERTSIDAYHPPHNTGSLRTLTLREGQRTGDRLVMLTVSGNPDYALTRPMLNTFVDAVRAAIEPKEGGGKLVIFLRIQQAIKGKPTQFYEMLLYGPDHIEERLQIDLGPHAKPIEVTFTISPSAFFQPNTRQAERIYSLALQMVQLSLEDSVYDLYCGTGTLGLCAATQAKEVIGIELSRESVLDARTNVQKMGIGNITIIAGDVGEELGKLKAQDGFKPPQVVIVDPPRVGLDEQALCHLISLKAAKILYVSCNPATQAENVAHLIKEGGYQLTVVQPVDQFPHTTHIESIALLTRG